MIGLMVHQENFIKASHDKMAFLDIHGDSTISKDESAGLVH